MKIGIDGLLLRGRDAGSLRYFELLLDSLAYAEQQHHISNQYTVFATQRVLRSASLPGSNSFSYRETKEWHILPGALQQQVYNHWNSHGKLDLLHTPVFIPPLSYPGKTVMTLFDLTFLLYPQTQKWTGRLWWNLLGAKGFKKAERIITISKSTRRDLCQYLDIPENKVDVIYPFVPEHYRPLADNISTAERRIVADKYHLPEKYILFVSTLERRKNISTLLQAFARVNKNSHLQHKLVLVGQPGWLYEDIYHTIQDLDIEKQVILLGYVPEVDLPGLYHAADLFAFLSNYEGFGFPALEAMSCGVPILASNSSSLPEVIGNAGVMVPPMDVEQAAAEMLHILTDADLRIDLIQRGIEQARRFSREQFQRETLSIYQQVIDSSTTPSQVKTLPVEFASPKISYTIPPGVLELKDVRYPAGYSLTSLATPQSGMVVLDKPMIELWRKAHDLTISETLAWAQTKGRAPTITRAAVTCLVQAGLLQRKTTPGTQPWIPEAAQPPPITNHQSTTNQSQVSTILVNYNSLSWLEACLASLASQTQPPTEIIIVDNGSTDDSVAWLKGKKGIHLIQIEESKPLSYALNLGIRAASGKYYLLINPDLILAPDAIEKLVCTAQTDSNCAAVAAKLKFLWAPAFLNGLGNYVGGFSWGTDSALGHLDLGQFDHWRLLPSACFATALLPARTFTEVGDIDECFPMYYEDSEWCYRARLYGYNILAAPQAVVYHALGSRVPTISEPGLTPRKLHHIVFGRLRFLIKIVSTPMLIWFLFSYLADDLAQLITALMRRKWSIVQAYLAGWKDFLKTITTLRCERQMIQARRKISDKVLFSLQHKIPMPLVWHGIPQLTWDLVQHFYLPFLATHFTHQAPELSLESISAADAGGTVKSTSPRPSFLQRARQIRSDEGAMALLHRIGRYIQWQLRRP